MSKILFVGAHCDDIELSCGGVIDKLRKNNTIYCVIFSHFTLNKIDLKKICKKSLRYLGVENIYFYNFKPSHFHKKRQKIWRILNSINKEISPDFVFTHEQDEHQDHEVLNKEVIRIFRKNIIEFHIPRSNVNFKPNLFFKLTKENMLKKRTAVNFYKEIYPNKNYLDDENIVVHSKYYGAYFEYDFVEPFKIRNLMIDEKYNDINF